MIPDIQVPYSLNISPQLSPACNTCYPPLIKPIENHYINLFSSAGRIKVAGEGVIKAAPDRAEIAIGVVTENKQLEQAQQENAAKTAAVISTLKQMGIPEQDIQTQSYLIDIQYDYSDGKQIFRAYKVQHGLRVVVSDISRIGE